MVKSSSGPTLIRITYYVENPNKIIDSQGINDLSRTELELVRSGAETLRIREGTYKRALDTGEIKTDPSRGEISTRTLAYNRTSP